MKLVKLSNLMLRIPHALIRRIRYVLIVKTNRKKIVIGYNVRIASPHKLQLRGNATLKIGDNTIIEDDTLLNLSGDCQIGSNCYLSVRVLIGCSLKVLIGNQVAIGPNVIILDTNHEFDDVNRPIVEQGAVSKEVIIGNDCWIGANAVILPGVKLEQHVVVASGSVVTKSFPKNVLVGGVPARILRELT